MPSAVVFPASAFWPVIPVTEHVCASECYDMPMSTSVSLDEVLSRHDTGLTAAEVIEEFDAALTAAEVVATPLTHAEVAFLRKHGGPGIGESLDSWDPAVERRERGHAAARRVAEALAESLSVSEAAAQLDVDPSRISHRIRRGTLWSFTMGRRRRIPRWQIMPEGRLLPGLSVIVPAIPTGIDPRAVHALLTTEQDELGDQTSLSYLAAGGEPSIVADLLADLGRW